MTVRVSDEVLLDTYARLGSVHKVGAEVGMRGSSVHERLVRLRAGEGLVKASLPVGQKTFEVTCPACRGVRVVTRASMLRIVRTGKHHLCASCSGKAAAGWRIFETRMCTRCGEQFQAVTSQRRSRCDTCTGRSIPHAVRECAICGRKYRPHTIRAMNGEGCSRACRARIRLNETYYGGRMFEADGWQTKTCQACGKTGLKGRQLHVHHAYGHPDHSHLLVLCAGCHATVTQMARAKHPIEVDCRLAALAEMQRRRGPLTVGESADLAQREQHLTELAASLEIDGFSVVAPTWFVVPESVDRALRHAEGAAAAMRAKDGVAKLPVVIFRAADPHSQRSLVVMRIADAEDWFGLGIRRNVPEEAAG